MSEADLTQPVRYPLWCVDAGATAEESRYTGPFDTIEEANAMWREMGGLEDLLVRRCRRVEVSEIVDPEDLLAALLEVVEERSSEGEGPDDSWRDWSGEVVVRSESALASFKTWLAEQVTVEQFVCEGDEP